MFGDTLDAALDRIESVLPRVQLYLVSQWATVRSWTAWASRHGMLVADNSGTGPCDVFDGSGRPRPVGMRSLQNIVDAYWTQVEWVCAAHDRCFTDGNVQRRFRPTDSLVAGDLGHLSVAGHRAYARLAWQALPQEIKQRR